MIENKNNSLIKDFFKGLLIGMAFLIPGLSGGTMMIILDVFEKGVNEVNLLVRFKKFDWKFLFTLGIGAVLGIVAFSSIISFFIKNYNMYTMYLFFGVIVGGLIEIFNDIKEFRVKPVEYIYILIGILLIFLLQLIPTIDGDMLSQNSIQLYVILIIIGLPLTAALILPGISTSFLLLTFGIYDHVLDAIMTVNLTILIPLIIGLIVGVLVLMRLLHLVLIKYKKQTYLVIIGFVVASLIQVFLDTALPNVGQLFICIIVFILGYILVRVLNKYVK